MTHPDNGREVGQLLGSSVPDLPAPLDRLAAVGRRVRRQRLRQTLLAACVMLTLIGTPALVTAGRTGTVEPTPDPPRPDAVTCPAELPLFPQTNGSLPTSEPGVLAPPGAVRAVLCRYDPLPEYQVIRPGPARKLVLTRDVAGLVAALNQLPVDAGIDPCFVSGGGGYLTLFYRDGKTATIELGYACGYVRRGGITRHNGWEAIAAFDERYGPQELAAAVPNAVLPADCAPRLTRGVAPGRFSPDPVTDVWLHSFDGAHRYLPVPLAVVTACRYTRGADGDLVRIQQVTDRDAVRQTADAVEAAVATWAGQIPFIGCTSDAAVRTVDVLVLRDVVGETFEVRVLRDTCPAVTFGFDAAPPNTAISTVLDQMLGPPV